MHYLNGILGLMLIAFAVVGYGADGGMFWSGVYALGAGLALFSMHRSMNIWTVRVLAAAATLTMFFYFAGFFARAPVLGDDWYQGEGARHIVMLLLAAFCMMPVVAEYSCQMKSAAAGIAR